MVKVALGGAVEHHPAVERRANRLGASSSRLVARMIVEQAASGVGSPKMAARRETIRTCVTWEERKCRFRYIRDDRGGTTVERELVKC